MRAEDMFVLDAAGQVLHTPEARPPPYKPPKLSECAPLFMSVRAGADAARLRAGNSPAVRVAAWHPPALAHCHIPEYTWHLCSGERHQGPAACAHTPWQAFELRGAGAVLHGHSMNAFLATLLDPEASELAVTHIEMIKGIAGQVGQPAGLARGKPRWAGVPHGLAGCRHTA